MGGVTSPGGRDEGRLLMKKIECVNVAALNQTQSSKKKKKNPLGVFLTKTFDPHQQPVGAIKYFHSDF